MVRTKADRLPSKAVGSKAPQKMASKLPPKQTGKSNKKKSSSGGNPAHPRDTPNWQKPITEFLNQSASSSSQEISSINDNEILQEENANRSGDAE